MREAWRSVGLLPDWACCNNSVLFMRQDRQASALSGFI